MLSIVIPAVVVLGIAAVAVGIVFFAVKLRSGEPISIPFRSLLTGYFYLLSIAGLITMLIGLSGLFNAGLSVVLGRDFSYFRPPVARILAPPAPEGVNSTQRPTPTPEEQQLEAERQQEREFREGLLQGISMVIVGGLVWALHSLGRRRIETDAERESGFFNMAYLAILLVLCSLIGMISLASGVFETLRFYLIEPNEFDFRSPPGQNASLAIVFTPAWAYYLMSMIRHVRKRQRA